MWKKLSSNSPSYALELQKRIDWLSGFIGKKENVSNKAISINGNTESDDKYPSVKMMYDWVIELFTSYITPLQITKWDINGNSNTNSDAHYIGTSDQQDLSIKTNNQLRFTIKEDGNIVIGDSSLSGGSKLQVNGDIEVNNTIRYKNTPGYTQGEQVIKIEGEQPIGIGFADGCNGSTLEGISPIPIKTIFYVHNGDGTIINEEGFWYYDTYNTVWKKM